MTKSNAEKAAEQQAADRGELTAKIAGILGSQQAQDAGIEQADNIDEPGAIGLVLDDGSEWFVTVDPA